MKKKKAAFTTIMVMICMFYCGTVGEYSVNSRIQDSKGLQWASESYIVLDGQMINAKNSEILFDTQTQIFI